MGCSQTLRYGCDYAFLERNGHLLGLKDKYNLCKGSIDEIKWMCEMIFREET